MPVAENSICNGFAANFIVGVIGGTAAWFFFYAIFALKIRRNDIFNSVTSVFVFCILVCQLNVLSACAVAAVVSRYGARKSDHVAGGFAALRVNWVGRATSNPD